MQTQSKWLQRLLTSAIILSVMQITACGEFSYKRGATTADLENSKLICSQQYQTKSEINQCLKQQGWIVVDMDEETTELEPETEIEEELLLEETVTATYTKNENDPFVAAEKAKIKAKQETKKQAIKDTTQRVKVNSWWKAGAGMDQLRSEGQTCLKSLGDKHFANENLSEVSIGVARCMQKNKWKFMLAK